ncbi:MAG: hypothetical protein Q7R47_05565, partial [Candidatus Diapherotrites archaeon]|nr:hypothetical protein [Candidatus Diapherotrites archaeon]
YCMGRHYDTVVPGTYYVALANSFSIPAGSVPNTNGTIPTELPAVKFDGSMLDAQYASVSYSCS